MLRCLPARRARLSSFSSPLHAGSACSCRATLLLCVGPGYKLSRCCLAGGQDSDPSRAQTNTHRSKARLGRGRQTATAVALPYYTYGIHNSTQVKQQSRTLLLSWPPRESDTFFFFFRRFLRELEANTSGDRVHAHEKVLFGKVANFSWPTLNADVIAMI